MSKKRKNLGNFRTKNSFLRSNNIYLHRISKQRMSIRQQFLTHAEGMFMRYGIKSVSMDDLAKDLGVSKKTLYQLVPNKADLITQIFHQHIKAEKEAIGNINATAKDAVQEIIEIARYIISQLRDMSPQVIFDLQKYYKETWQLLQGLHQKFAYQIIKANIERGIKEGLYRENLNPDIVAKLYLGKSWLVVDDSLFPLKEYNSEQLFKEMIAYHIHGIASVKGLKLLAKYSKDLL